MNTAENSTLKCPIHSFESMGAVDGPGLRFVVFTQGCNLQCKYCQNIDTWTHSGGTFYTVDELLEKILRYKNYFTASGGGVTISGGEPLIHMQFLIELFKKLKEHNIHTAIDTSGVFYLTPGMIELINLTDLFLLDIKCINDEICKNLTSVSNQKELEFAKYLSSIGKPMWIRQVLVPGYTDKEEDLLKLKEFLASLSSVQKVEILPYHDMGKHKWLEMGLTYPLEGVRVVNSDDVDRAKKILGLN